MLANSLIKRMHTTDKKLVRDGAITGMMFTGAIAYWNYRERIRKQFFRSEGHYRFSHALENCTPWK